jgi:hypothetical protein
MQHGEKDARLPGFTRVSMYVRFSIGMCNFREFLFIILYCLLPPIFTKLASTMKFPILILLFLLALPAMAQFPSDHAVLYHSSGTLPDGLAEQVTRLGGRVAVRARHAMIVRITEGAAQSLRRLLPEVLVLRDAEEAGRFSTLRQADSWLLKMLPGDHLSTDDFTENACGLSEADMQHSCLSHDEACHPDAVRAAMKTQFFGTSTDPNKTSDVMVGSTVVAVMCVNNINAQQQGVPTWTEQLRTNALANIMVNLAWWSDQAAEYSKEKTFIIREYPPDNPVCAIDFDPTEGYTTTSFSINDHKFQNPLMDALGYSGANQTVKMRAFCNDLRTDEGTDWAYIAFLLVGKYSVRAHASFGGPSTVLMANSAGSGFVYAHETGHIFNAYDEYFESGVSNFRAKQTRFGVPNGNHHFRNHPVQPAMMASNYRALSGYAAVHLGLADSVRLVTVRTVPGDAAFEVEYIAPNNAVSNLGRFQGTTRFAWGNGTRVRLRALSEIGHGGYRHTAGVWSESGGDELTMRLDSNSVQSISLTYSPGNDAVPLSFEYLTLANALASELVQDILPLGERSAAFVGQKGISIWNDTGKIILDHPIANRGSAVFRESYSVARGPDNTLYFSSQSSEIVSYGDRGIGTLTGPLADITYRNIAVTDDGAVWATDGGIVGGRDMQASGVHRFHEGAVTAYTASNSPLPSNSIVSIASAGGPAVYLGYGGKDARDQGLFVFDPSAMSITDRSSLAGSPMISKLRVVGADSLLIISRGAGGSDTWITLLVGNTPKHWQPSYFQGMGTVNDAAIDHQGRLAVATSQGLLLIDDGSAPVQYRMANSELIANICYSVARAAGDGLIVGSNNGAVLIRPASTATSVAAGDHRPSAALLHEVYPNPLTAQGAGIVAVTINEPGGAELRIHDILGREVALLASGRFAPGRHSFTLPSSLPAGMYVLSMTSDGRVQSAKFQVVR